LPRPITAGHQKAAIGEIEKPFRLGARLEMPGDRAPAVAPHCGGPVMIAADAERHALGGAAGEFRMQQYVELLAVTGGKRGVEGAGACHDERARKELAESAPSPPDIVEQGRFAGEVEIKKYRGRRRHRSGYFAR
jgi:hypothetical protein